MGTFIVCMGVVGLLWKFSYVQSISLNSNNFITMSGCWLLHDDAKHEMYIHFCATFEARNCSISPTLNPLSLCACGSAKRILCVVNRFSCKRNDPDILPPTSFVNEKITMESLSCPTRWQIQTESVDVGNTHTHKHIAHMRVPRTHAMIRRYVMPRERNMRWKCYVYTNGRYYGICFIVASATFIAFFLLDSLNVRILFWSQFPSLHFSVSFAIVSMIQNSSRIIPFFEEKSPFDSHLNRFY